MTGVGRANVGSPHNHIRRIRMVERVIILFLAFAVLWVVFYFIAKLVRPKADQGGPDVQPWS